MNKYWPLAGCALLALTGAAAAHAAQCSNATLLGAYGYQEEGQAIGAGFSQFRSVGELAFDGAGKVTRVTTIWYSTFEVAPETPSAITYSVSPDCRFTFTYSNGETFTGVITAGGTRLLYIETSGDPSRSGRAERIRSDQ